MSWFGKRPWASAALTALALTLLASAQAQTTEPAVDGTRLVAALQARGFRPPERFKALVVRLDADVKAVIALYNAIPGSSLELVLESGITGDSDLGSPSAENYGTQTIVIGFTDSTLGSKDAEAWMSPNPSDGCTRTRAHISFRKDLRWIFGPPDSNDVDGRSFYTAAQPPIGSSTAITFLGILTHEMGHAVGLAHPDDSYAVMAAFTDAFAAQRGLSTSSREPVAS